jgi:hypothetical protein
VVLKYFLQSHPFKNMHRCMHTHMLHIISTVCSRATQCTRFSVEIKCMRYNVLGHARASPAMSC